MALVRAPRERRSKQVGGDRFFRREPSGRFSPGGGAAALVLTRGRKDPEGDVQGGSIIARNWPSVYVVRGPR